MSLRGSVRVPLQDPQILLIGRLGPEFCIHTPRRSLVHNTLPVKEETRGGSTGREVAGAVDKANRVKGTAGGVDVQEWGGVPSDIGGVGFGSPGARVGGLRGDCGGG